MSKKILSTEMVDIMVNHVQAVKFVVGQTVENFMEQFTRSTLEPDAVIPWEGIGGLFDHGVIGPDGKKTFYLPLLTKERK